MRLYKNEVSSRAGLIARLREGPLHTDKWSEVAASRKSLHVRIYRLRELGYIVNVHTPAHNRESKGHPPVVYTLVAEPEDFQT